MELVKGKKHFEVNLTFLQTSEEINFMTMTFQTMGMIPLIETCADLKIVWNRG
jgi:hypothetical protein